ncbi:hypothetical protein HPB48_015668 [Haemaphysalis longicornis]|uniref:Uncharacterized protein n=1 Tax=Haemaphysalis longicornis TaxID=44386 RepID=A0A9J6GII8_HAELO|nr:hypothetical protein HPB48_015668 [Haemaphysalis longicornis]
MQRYHNFMLLHVGIRVLEMPRSCCELKNYAHRLLVSFVETFINLYGSQHVTYNVHGLVHLAQDVRQFGPLDDCSAFPSGQYGQEDTSSSSS